MPISLNFAAFGTPVEMLRGTLERGLLDSSIALPVLPEIAGQVIPLANDPNAQVDELADLIERDQTLAATVLRFANSIAFSHGEEIASLRHAMMHLGTSVISGIALAACLEGEAFQTPAYNGYRRRVLVHAVLTGGLARDLARRLRRNPDLAFMCALLHSIGKPVVLRLITDLQRASRIQIGEYEAIPLVNQFEAVAAEAATTAWNLPQHVRIVATHYRNPDAAPAFVLETRITALASRLALWIAEGRPRNEADVRAFPDWDVLSILPEEIDEIVAMGLALRQSPRVLA
jgi:HD-like signal output (HDOD) protein